VFHGFRYVGLAQIQQQESPIRKSQANTAIFIARSILKIYNVYEVKLTTHKPEVFVFASSGGRAGRRLKPPGWFLPPLE
jgi:hypothetical protein